MEVGQITEPSPLTEGSPHWTAQASHCLIAPTHPSGRRTSSVLTGLSFSTGFGSLLWFCHQESKSLKNSIFGLRVWLAEGPRGLRGKQRGHDSVLPVLHSPGLHRMKRQLRCFRPQGPSLQPQPPCPEFLLQHGCSLPITPPPPGSPPASLTLSWRLRRAQQAFQAAPGGGSFLFPRAWVFLFWVCFLFLNPGSSICLIVKPKRITDFFFL